MTLAFVVKLCLFTPCDQRLSVGEVQAKGREYNHNLGKDFTYEIIQMWP